MYVCGQILGSWVSMCLIPDRIFCTSRHSPSNGTAFASGSTDRPSYRHMHPSIHCVYVTALFLPLAVSRVLQQHVHPLCVTLLITLGIVPITVRALIAIALRILLTAALREIVGPRE